jgi:hypothetical protein
VGSFVAFAACALIGAVLGAQYIAALVAAAAVVVWTALVAASRASLAAFILLLALSF